MFYVGTLQMQQKYPTFPVNDLMTECSQDLPMVLSDQIAKLPSGEFWLGGGHVDLKLCLKVDESVKTFGFAVADVTS